MSMEKPDSNTPTFAICGAANRVAAAARDASSQKQASSVTSPYVSIYGVPTGPQIPTELSKQRKSSAGSNPNPVVIPARKDSSDAYPHITNLPPSASEVARRISELPTLRPLRLNYKNRVLIGTANAHLEATLGQQRGEMPVNNCSQCVHGEERVPFINCIVVPGEFSGACCNCRFLNEGRNCDLRVGFEISATPQNDSFFGVYKASTMASAPLGRKEEEE
ncbi:hypothetical protein VTL71DRAFT_9336 [Oculimacula yallundae]|uniref:Uncharacterized protein n=1 Tax=Oculimacula yallundae TaxID=86028 RepID=A0ABR4BSS1_9HELO